MLKWAEILMILPVASPRYFYATVIEHIIISILNIVLSKNFKVSI